MEEEEDEAETKDEGAAPGERMRDDVDEYLEEARQKANAENEKAEGEEAKFTTSGVRDAQHHPKWMKRIEFGSKVLPEAPCITGDAQSELIHIIILMMANNLAVFLQRHCGFWCEDVKKLASAHAAKDQMWRMDVDPKIPFLSKNENGDIIEPTDQQLEEHYDEHGNTETKHDLGKDGYVRSYHGSFIFKKLANYVLECGYTPEEYKNIFSSGSIRRKIATETIDDEEDAYQRATTDLAEQSRFMMRFIIAGAFNANAVCFFRNANSTSTQCT
eukprot:s3204_g8.t1